MDLKNVSRRRFVGGLAAALGYVTTGPSFDVLAQGRAAGQGRPGPVAGAGRAPQTEAQYDALAKLANNENNYGIPDSVMKSMTGTGSTPVATAIPTRVSTRRSRNSMASSRRTHGHRRFGRSARRRRHDLPARTARRCSASIRRTARSISTPPTSSPTRSSCR